MNNIITNSGQNMGTYQAYTGIPISSLAPTPDLKVDAIKMMEGWYGQVFLWGEIVLEVGPCKDHGQALRKARSRFIRKLRNL